MAPGKLVPERQLRRGAPFRGGGTPTGYGGHPHDKRGWLAAYTLPKTTATRWPLAGSPLSVSARVSLSVQQRKNVTTKQRNNVSRRAGHRTPCALAAALSPPRPWPKAAAARSAA